MDITTSPKSLTKILVDLISIGQPVMITGRPGIGKTDIVNAAAKQLGADVIKYDCVVADPIDFKGLPLIDGGKARFEPFSDLKRLIVAKDLTICFLDDLGQASPAVQAAVMQLVLARNIGEYPVSDNVVFVAATNRREDKAGVSGILEPVKSRFSIFELEPTLNDWMEWALNKPSMPIEIIQACRFKPEWITKWVPEKGITNSPTPRNLEVVGEMIANGIDNSLRLPMFASRLGRAAATELMAFLDLYAELPNVDSIVLNPDTATVPDNPSSKYALSGALAEKSNDQNFGAVMQYMDRMPSEYMVCYLKTISARKPKLQNTSAFIKWVTANQDVIF
jgi:MoxR-like ATPase